MKENKSRNLLSMMEEIMGHVVGNVPKHPTAVYCHSSVPVIEEQGMREFVKRNG